MYLAFFKTNWPWIAMLAFAAVSIGGYRSFISPPADFPSGSIVVVAQGLSAPQVARGLADARVIAHPMSLELLVRLGAKSTRIQAGAYRFESPQNVFTIARRLVTGAFGLPLTRITFIEGVTVREIAAQVEEAFPGISAADFASIGEPHEGYLFPDTYFFSPSADAESIVRDMRDNFNAQTAPLAEETRASGHSLSEIVMMASLIEKEARGITDKRLVSGILWNRLERDMPLQVDAARETYEHKGFPAVPIANPGLESLEAALHPAQTDYFYYLTGNDGLMHYAKTFTTHQSNIRKFLN
ncbi:MAG: endolytic transglycosylase MltG [Candidatus Paceibacterota bacterium]|jgi:UPF0755 protein